MASEHQQTQQILVVAIVAGFAAAVTLVLPWIRIGSRARSSIDLIGSLGALDVIEGATKFAVVLAWLLTPVLVAAAMLVGASGRYRLSAALLAPLGLLLGGIVLLVFFVAGDTLAWGAYLTAVCAIAASVFALLVLVRLRRST
jgi:hypothetical protein